MIPTPSVASDGSKSISVEDLRLLCCICSLVKAEIRSAASGDGFGGSSLTGSQPTGGEPGGDMRKFFSILGGARWYGSGQLGSIVKSGHKTLEGVFSVR